MSWLGFSRRRRRDEEVRQEMALHLEAEIEENVERGMSREEARRTAHRKFGSTCRVREEVWRMNSMERLEGVWREFVYVLRRLKKAPTTVLTVMVSLGLGIAANVVVFSGVNKLAFQGPPVGEPATLLSLDSVNERGPGGRMSEPVFESVRGQAKSFSGIAAFTTFALTTISGQGEPERAWGQSVTTNFFDVSQVPMSLGRGFASGEGHTPVVVLSYGLWLHRFRGDSGVIGKTVLLSGKPFTVVGVTKPGFHGVLQIMDTEFWIPLDEQVELDPASATYGLSVVVIGRLRPNISVSAAQAEMNGLALRLAAEFPKERKGMGLQLQKAGTLPFPVVSQITAFIAAVMAVALLVLCIAGSNVANLLLSRAMARHREMAVRIALGATRWQLIRPMLIESVLLSIGGGMFGIGMSLLAMRGLTVFHPPIDVPIDLILNVDQRVLVYAFLLSVGAGLLCGIGPAIAATRPMVPNALKGESGLERAGRRWTLRNVLVVVQISACMVLLCTTGLYLHGLAKFANIDPGFRMDGVRILSIDPIHNGYKAEQIPLLLKRVREGVTMMPGVVSAAWTDSVPLAQGMRGTELHVTGRAANPGHDVLAMTLDVDPAYFATMAIPRVAGRDFSGAGPDAPKELVVNEALAKLMFNGRSAVGEHLTPSWPVNSHDAYEIVGVVKNTKSTNIQEEDKPIAYQELAQNTQAGSPVFGYSLMVHYQGNRAEMATALHNQVHSVDPLLGVFSEKEMGEQVTDSMLIPRAESTIFGTFGLMGLILAAVGLYGVMSYSVQRRTQEIGIRLALGARRSGVQGLIVRQGMTLSAIALVIGLPLALAASKIAAKMQYGIAAYDPVSFIWMPVFLSAVALFACWIPSRRAATVDPQVALRHE